jgi:formylmethanofuran dehydrogenase subunit D
MVFVLCSIKPGEETGSISFSGSQLAKFGFDAGCKVIVDISKGQIVIKLIDNSSNNHVDIPHIERGF